MSTVVTFGEIMLRLTTPGWQRFAQAPHFEITLGGAEANVAVTIAQLGGAAEFVTRLPQNEIADRAVDELRARGVGVRHIARGGDRIGVYFLEQGASQRPGKVIYDRANSAIAEAQSGDFGWAEIFAGADWFHWSGITPALSPAVAEISREACAAARQAGLKVSFDMNYRAKLWTQDEAGAALRPLMGQVDLCVCGAEEARRILGASGETEEQIARNLQQQFGFATVAMTQRQTGTASATSWGATLYSGRESYTSRRHEITIVDRVGAGDCFTGALIFAMMRGDDPQQAIELAVAASTLKHTIPGDFALLSLQEVEALARGGDGGRVQR
jgi:2-dehydro-3-deoxygluconokinase